MTRLLLIPCKYTALGMVVYILISLCIYVCFTQVYLLYITYTCSKRYV